jgi:hypothetical protein
METVKFNLTTFDDLKTNQLTGIIRELFLYMEIQIDAGNVILIERQYSNAPPDKIDEFTTREELQRFKASFVGL